MADQNKKKYIKYEDTTYILEDSRIPDPSSADNGKVLGVVNGAYALKQEEGGSGAVTSVNGKTGAVVLDAEDVGALPDDTVIPAAVTEQTVAGWGFTKNTGTYSKPSGGIPASDLASGVIPTVPQMAMQANMSDWSSGKVVDAGALATSFGIAVAAIQTKANASDVYTKTELDDAIGVISTQLANKANKSDIASMYKYKGSVATVSNLPSSNQSVGDVYNVESTGMNYAWDGTEWDALGTAVDLSGYATEQWVQNQGYLTQHQSLANYQTKAITDTGGYYTTDTVEGALQEIGAELAGINTLIGSGVIS